MAEILHHLRCIKPVSNGINYLSTGAGFLPSTEGHQFFLGNLVDEVGKLVNYRLVSWMISKPMLGGMNLLTKLLIVDYIVNNPTCTSGGPNLSLRWYPQQQGNFHLGPSRFGINNLIFFKAAVGGWMLENVSWEIAKLIQAFTLSIPKWWRSPNNLGFSGHVNAASQKCHKRIARRRKYFKILEKMFILMIPLENLEFSWVLLTCLTDVFLFMVDICPRESQVKSPSFQTEKKRRGTQGNAPANGQIVHKVVQKCRKNNGKTPGIDGGFNPSAKYLSNWKSSPNRGENKNI